MTSWYKQGPKIWACFGKFKHIKESYKDQDEHDWELITDDPFYKSWDAKLPEDESIFM